MRGVDLLKDIGYIDDSLVQEAALDTGISKKGKTVSWSKWTRWGSIAAGFAVLCIAAVAFRQNFRSYDATESACMTDSTKSSAKIYSTNDAVIEEAAEMYAEDNAAAAEDTAIMPEAEKSNTTSHQSVVTEDAKAETQEIHLVKDYSMEIGADGEVAKMEVEVCYAVPGKGEYFYFYELEEAMKEYAGQAVEYYVAIDVFGDCTNAQGETVYEALTYSQDGYDEQTSQIMKEYERLLAEGYRVIIEEDELRGYFTEDELNAFAVNSEYGYAFRFTEKD
ncbi:MAG: hypothetical protein E7290_10360 [Lachnospiraceae bacterium]|nr:hypothetical protein [Lachnospiraceae bacterium]